MRPFNVSMFNNVSISSLKIEHGLLEAIQLDDEGIWLNETSAKVTFTEIEDNSSKLFFFFLKKA